MLAKSYLQERNLGYQHILVQCSVARYSLVEHTKVLRLKAMFLLILMMTAFVVAFLDLRA